MSDRPALIDRTLLRRLGRPSAERMGFRDRSDLLGRVYTVAVVARSLLGLHAVFVNLFYVVNYTDKPLGVVAATLALIAWHLFISWRMRTPANRTWQAHVADLGVTVTLILTTVITVPPLAAPLSLAGYWISGCAAYAAIFLSTRWGVAFALVTSAALLGVPSHFELQRLGAAFVTVILIASLGVLIEQFRATIVEQEEERSRTAALAERERLSRIVHDGALQVLALVEREGPGLGGRGIRLAALARESEAQLRVLLQDREIAAVEPTALVDLAAALDRFHAARVTVSTMASVVRVPRHLAAEVQAALTEVLNNVEAHAGDDAQAWILLDQERDDEVILWVRDNGVGMDPSQVVQAAESGRMGIKDSIVGRMTALGGSAILKSSPGAGTEWELRFPIDVEAVEQER